jgi:hypothetical protein
MNTLRVMAAAMGVCAVLTIPIVVIGQTPQTPSDRPVFVDEDAWVPLTPNLGIVLTGKAVPTDARENLMNTRPVAGYFMAKVGGAWRTVIVDQPVRPMPAH